MPLRDHSELVHQVREASGSSRVRLACIRASSERRGVPVVCILPVLLACLLSTPKCKAPGFRLPHSLCPVLTLMVRKCFASSRTVIIVNNMNMYSG